MPRFEDYPAGETFTGAPVKPKLATPLEQSYSEQIRDGVEKGHGVFRDSKEQKGPNFAGNLIVIQWGMWRAMHEDDDCRCADRRSVLPSDLV